MSCLENLMKFVVNLLKCLVSLLKCYVNLMKCPGKPNEISIKSYVMPCKTYEIGLHGKPNKPYEISDVSCESMKCIIHIYETHVNHTKCLVNRTNHQVNLVQCVVNLIACH